MASVSTKTIHTVRHVYLTTTTVLLVAAASLRCEPWSYVLRKLEKRAPDELSPKPDPYELRAL